MMILTGSIIAATAGCGSEIKRSLNNEIDEQEEAAAELVEVLEGYLAEFEPQLRETTELMATQWERRHWNMLGRPPTEFNGDVDHDYDLVINNSCPGVDSIGRNRPRSDVLDQQDLRSKCLCFRNIVLRYMNELNALSSEHFAEGREQIAALTDEELVLLAPTIRNRGSQYSIERAERNAAERREAAAQNPRTTHVLRYCRF